MNIELLRAAAQLEVNMFSWYSTRYPDDLRVCKTVGCLAGNVCILAGLKPTFNVFKWDIEDTTTGKIYTSGNIFNLAKDFLDIDIHEACLLFLLHHWPAEFSTQYTYISQSIDRPLVVQARVEHFIATGK